MNDITRPLDLFEQFNRAYSDWFGRDMEGFLPRDGGRWLPAVDIRESDGKFLIEVEVPGFKSEEVHVSVDDRILSIEGERVSESKEEKEGYIRTERQRGRFVRRFTLPSAVQSEDIAASVKDGVLTIEVPQAAAREPRKIPVS